MQFQTSKRLRRQSNSILQQRLIGPITTVLLLVACEQRFVVETKDANPTQRDTSIALKDASKEKANNADGTADSLTNDSITPTDGKPDVCAPGELLCCGSCIDPSTNADHCGKCNTKCCSFAVCSGGNCALVCSPNQTTCGSIVEPNCDGQCVNVSTSDQHCGSCGIECCDSSSCENGSCQFNPYGCAAPQIICGSATKPNCTASCFDPKSSNLHCGACDNQCTNGKVCTAGKCI